MKLIHRHSTGSDLFDNLGLKVLFEPLRGRLEGVRLLRHDRLLPQRLRCMYECKGCTREALHSGLKIIGAPMDRGQRQPWAKRMREAQRAQAITDSKSQTVVDGGAAKGLPMLCQEHTLAIKTTRILNLTSVAVGLSAASLRTSRFVLLLRDPRAVWASLREFKPLAIRSIPFVCTAPPMQLSTAPALAGHAAVLALWYARWSQSPEVALCALARLAGLPALPRAWHGALTREIHAGSVRSWVRKVPAEELAALERNGDCRAYMKAAGYRLTRTGNATDYSALRDDLLRPPPHMVSDDTAAVSVEGCPDV